MILCDTHTHLYLPQFDDDRDEVVQQAIADGVKYMLLPNIDSGSAKAMLALSAKYPKNCFPMMGLHPSSVKENIESELQNVEQWLAKKRFCGVGETGIDLYWDKSFRQQQLEAFEFQAELAKKHQLPLVIHSREAFDEVFSVLDKVCDERLSGVFHCFTGTRQQAEKALSYGGFKLGIGGVLTFKNSGLDKVIQTIDLENIVLETDSPYLAPTPHRGKRNQSQYLLIVARKLAQIHQLPIPEIAKITTQNAKNLFKMF